MLHWTPQPKQRSSALCCSSHHSFIVHLCLDFAPLNTVPFRHCGKANHHAFSWILAFWHFSVPFGNVRKTATIWVLVWAAAQTAPLHCVLNANKSIFSTMIVLLSSDTDSQLYFVPFQIQTKIRAPLRWHFNWVLPWLQKGSGKCDTGLIVTTSCSVWKRSRKDWVLILVLSGYAVQIERDN